MNGLYVIARDSGCEGHSEPLQVFYDIEHARAAIRLAESAYASCMRIYLVPVWPDREPTLDVTVEALQKTESLNAQSLQPNSDAAMLAKTRATAVQYRSLPKKRA